MKYTAREVKEVFLKFFQRNNHKQIKNSSIIPENDESLLFINSGMAPIKKVFTGEQNPEAKRMCNVQTCIRTNDIDSIGDMHHLSSFFMLGNWSVGDYFKQDAIKFAYDFLINELKINKEKLYVTVFSGDAKRNLPADEESEKLWQEVGIKKSHIIKKSFEDNFWRMGDGESPCGPCTEVFYDTESPKVKSYEESGFFDDKNRYIEIWNAGVFMQYFQHKDGTYSKLKMNSVDAGAGIERMIMALNNYKSVYESEIYLPVIQLIKNKTQNWNEKSLRVIADHARTSVYIINAGVEAGNLKREYILRRLLRRAIRHLKLIGADDLLLKEVVEVTIDNLNQCGLAPDWNFTKDEIVGKVLTEQEKFLKMLNAGLKIFEEFISEKNNIKDNVINSTLVFKLYDTYGFPFEITEELAIEKGLKVDENEFNKLFEMHKNISRGEAKIFKSGLADTSEQTVKLHTATHLLHFALRKTLGENVSQKGSNITPERLRFDFNFERKLTADELKQIEDLVNELIEKKLTVSCNEMDYESAKKSGAIGLFENKYGEKVKVYSIGEFSKELCSGPHVKNTKELGRFKITKEESSSAGIRRIKAVLL